MPHLPRVHLLLTHIFIANTYFPTQMATLGSNLKLLANTVFIIWISSSPSVSSFSPSGQADKWRVSVSGLSRFFAAGLSIFQT
jgi:hypothetical protein